MEREVDDDDFVMFPYPASADGAGAPGIDLTLETDRIDEVKECAHSANLRRLVEEVNLQEGLFMTLACDHVRLANGTAGYVDFAFRPDGDAHFKAETVNLDKHFWHYLGEQERTHQMTAGALVNYAQSVLEWAHSPVEIRGVRYDKVRVQYYCEQQDEAEWCLDHLRHFLVTCYPRYAARP